MTVRLGGHDVVVHELWVDALAGAARGAGLPCLGIFISTPVGIRRTR